ncbi:hypothetical protein E6C27_scaffold17G00830 [Cucumis melo var. makuwa]|uniref:Uncharacterized protein n=1 Tax=Cucumis melo var. makuwa TaxID=1194695 RepID=A0A5A7VAT5_CUCMM|nr:hypothetical protein E6C27_scaffold17G00830 [Cucumis melo var. makuwa]
MFVFMSTGTTSSFSSDFEVALFLEFGDEFNNAGESSSVDDNANGTYPLRLLGDVNSLNSWNLRGTFIRMSHFKVLYEMRHGMKPLRRSSGSYEGNLELILVMG